MDPEHLNHVDWRSMSVILRYILAFVGTVFFFAAHMVLAHAVIPSLLASGHIPDGIADRVRKLRFPLYVISLMFVGTLAFFLSEAADATHELRRIYWRDWI